MRKNYKKALILVFHTSFLLQNKLCEFKYTPVLIPSFKDF